MSIFDLVKDKIVEVAEQRANKKVNLYQAGKEADEKLDTSPLGEKNSERIQKGLVTDSFFEFLAGLHNDDKQWYADRLIKEAGAIEGGKYDE